jgi:hypothetical protein
MDTQTAEGRGGAGWGRTGDVLQEDRGAGLADGADHGYEGLAGVPVGPRDDGVLVENDGLQRQQPRLLDRRNRRLDPRLPVPRHLRFRACSRPAHSSTPQSARPARPLEGPLTLGCADTCERAAVCAAQAGRAWSTGLHGGPVLAAALDEDGRRAVGNVA